jgi:glycine/D-amino acid oxidase-like deaminating enzyme
MENQTFELNSWLDDVEALAFPSVESDLSVDWIIVGAGFTGVAAARKIASDRPDDQVLLVDAGEVLDGSSSRSSGFVVPIGHFYRPGSAENKKLHRIGSHGVSRLRNLVQQHEIQCGWNESGRLIGARARAGLSSLRKIKKALSALNSPIEEFEPEQVQSRTGMVGYLAAIRQKESVMVNPALLLKGLIESLPDNVRVMANSKVVSLGPNGEVFFSNGCKATASKIIVAVNAFANQIGIGRNRVFPMRTFVSVVEMHVGDQEEAGWGITSSERVGSSIRRVGKRLFIRNTAEFGLEKGSTEPELREIAGFQLRSLRSRFEGTADVGEFRVLNTWSGPISITANGASCFGQVSDQVFYSTGCNGHGIAHGTASGELLAQLAIGNGRRSELLTVIQSLRKPNWIPGDSILKAGVNAYVRMLLWRFGAEE